MQDLQRAGRWGVLAVSMLGQVFASMLQFGLPFLLPQLTTIAGGSVSLAAALVAAPSVGLILTLMGWGWFADRFGERLAMTLGLGAGAAAVALLAFVLREPAPIATLWALLCIASALLAAVNSASGRLVLAAFEPAQRGLAMGIRQTAQPLGIALSAGVFPPLAERFGPQVPFAFVAAGCAVAAGLVPRVAPRARPSAGTARSHARLHSMGGSPYGSAAIWRVHGASGLLTVGQFIFSVFGFSYLILRLEWSPIAAGLFFTLANLVSAGLRVWLGWFSDRRISRPRLLRSAAYGVAGCTALLVGFDELFVRYGSAELSGQLQLVLPLALAATLFAASAVSSSHNGLSYTLVAECAGPHWAGRAMGAQNTTQNLVAVAVPLLGTALVSVGSFALLLAVGALTALAAALLVPRSAPLAEA